MRAQVVTLRVVGRNTKGPLATATFGPLDGASFPVSFAITRAQLREGVPDFLWQEEDIYIKVGINSASGKEIVAGKSKAKFKDGTHEVGYVTLE